MAVLVIGMELVGTAPTPWFGVAPLLGLAILAITAALWWFKRTRHPLLDLRALRIHTFQVANSGGALYRLVISAVPFLLPLMFILGFGWSAFEAGMMTMVVFAGNLLTFPRPAWQVPTLFLPQSPRLLPGWVWPFVRWCCMPRKPLWREHPPRRPRRATSGRLPYWA
ncbi:hypothetical protein AAFM46_12820 [Arthrobacter sp. TMP15]|uniref:hypothetical protein n=1 Tax=Arthrobacter sp. TMP15 TaxID=3140789 RepID=UPI0031BAC484